MPFDPTVTDDNGNTYVALPCPSCGGDGCTFATMAEVFAGLAQAIARRLDDIDVTDRRVLDALVGMGAS